jgi:hypothetical protein
MVHSPLHLKILESIKVCLPLHQSAIPLIANGVKRLLLDTFQIELLGINMMPAS